MKLSFTTLGCPDWDLETAVARAGEYGFDGLDFRGCAGEFDLWKLPDFSARLDQTAGRIKDAGLQVPCLSSSAKLLADDQEARDAAMQNVIEFSRIAAGLGAPFVRVFGGYDADRSPDDALREAADRLDTMARQAARAGVAVLVETHDSWIATDRLCRLLDAATQANVGVIWDINHPFRIGEEPRETWANVGRWVRYIHIKDTRKLDDKKQPCLLGQGDIPVAEIVRLLRREAYRGWYAFEWEKKWHPEIEEPEVAFPRYVTYMRGLASASSASA